MSRTDYRRAERLADAAAHVAGLAFAAAAGPILLFSAVESGDPTRLLGASIYVAAMAAMLSISAAYNMNVWPSGREALRRLDHGTIYLKIAGSYTPFALAPLAEGSGPALLAGVWTAAGLGFAIKAIAPRRFEYAGLALYLALGWCMVFVLDEARVAIEPRALSFIVAGGLTYTIGVAFFLLERLPFHTAIWHFFVVAGTCLIYAAVTVELSR